MTLEIKAVNTFNKSDLRIDTFTRESTEMTVTHLPTGKFVKGTDVHEHELRERLTQELEKKVNVVPQHLLHVQCECGNEAFIDGKPDGWIIDIRGHINFLCPCGKVLQK